MLDAAQRKLREENSFTFVFNYSYSTMECLFIFFRSVKWNLKQLGTIMVWSLHNMGSFYISCHCVNGDISFHLRPRCDPDSGHDSGAEEGQDSPPFCFLTIGMGKILLPQGHAPGSQSHGESHSQGALHSHSSSHCGPPHSHTAPLPPRLGLCLDCDKGRVTYYDAHSLRVLWEGHVDCSAPLCPAFCFIGGGALQLQDLVANRSIEELPPKRVTIQPRATNLRKWVGSLRALIKGTVLFIFFLFTYSQG